MKPVTMSCLSSAVVAVLLYAADLCAVISCGVSLFCIFLNESRENDVVLLIGCSTMLGLLPLVITWTGSEVHIPANRDVQLKHIFELISVHFSVISSDQLYLISQRYI
jgi:hypothetical protein